MISYKPLHHTLLEKDMLISHLCEALNISTTIRARLNKDEYVSLGTLVKICNYLDVPIEKVIKITKEAN